MGAFAWPLLRFGVVLALLPVPSVIAQNVLTGNYDNGRTNAQLAESILTPASVGSGKFGKVFSLAVDGQVYAQPLYQAGLTVGKKGKHNVLFAATLHNSIYAFDADSPAAPLWKVNLGPAVPSASYNNEYQPGSSPIYKDIRPENGILSTPVIDPATGTLYAVAATAENGKYFYRIHALDTATGAEKFGAPIAISATVKGEGSGSSYGEIAFDPLQHLQRPGLLLANGRIYIAFGSHADTPPYHGWVFSYSAADVTKQIAVFNATPNGINGSIWQSGRGLATDESGNVFAATANGDADEQGNVGNSVLTLDKDRLSVKDWFTPSDFADLNDNDYDLGASGPLLVPGTKWLIEGGKSGQLFLLDRTSLGHLRPGDAQVPQSFAPVTFGIFTLALWNRSDHPILYLQGSGSALGMYSLLNGKLVTSPTSQSSFQITISYQGMAVSANGGAPGTGVLWTTTPDTYPLPATGTLRAYDAGDLTREIWDSGAVAADALGTFSKFATPTVANGRVYVPTCSGEIAVYGLKTGGANAPGIAAVVNAASYAQTPIAPGELVILFGQNLGPAALATGKLTGGTTLPGQLGGTQVTFNGRPAPVLYTSTNAVAVVVPFEVNGSSTVAIEASYNGLFSPVMTLPGGPASPGVFSADSSGAGAGAIINADDSPNSANAPATAGQPISLFVTGAGQTKPAGVAGKLSAIKAPQLAHPVSVSMGGVEAKVVYAGGAPQQLQGIIQINAIVPPGLVGAGAAPVAVSVAGQASQSGLVVYVK